MTEVKRLEIKKGLLTLMAIFDVLGPAGTDEFLAAIAAQAAESEGGA